MSLQDSAGENKSIGSSAAVMAASVPAVSEHLEALVEAIRMEDADHIASILDHLEKIQGPAAAFTIMSALETGGLKSEALFTPLKRRAQTLQTALAWSQLAGVAVGLGNDGLGIEAARVALERDPNNLAAAFVLIVVSNRRTEHESAKRAIADLTKRLPTVRNDPYIVVQTAIAELGLKQPQAALAGIEPALASLTAAGLGFDAQVLRGRALDQLPERSAEAVTAWNRVLESARNPIETDLARQGLAVALFRTNRLDECLHQIDILIAAAANDEVRAVRREMRANALVSKGDIEGALTALDELLGSAQNSTRRVELILRQARIAAGAAHWKNAADKYNQALAEIAPDLREERRAVQLEKARVLAPHDIDTVLTDLDEIERNWSAPGWPQFIDIGISGLLAAGRVDQASQWLTQRLVRTPALANHPAAFQMRGDIEFKGGNTEEAMRRYAHATTFSKDESDPRALIAALVCAFAAQEFNVAVSAHHRLMLVDPAAANTADLCVIAANAHLRLDNLERALDLTKDAQPNEIVLVAMREVVRSEAFARLGRLDDALETTAAALARLQTTNSSQVPASFMISLHTLRAEVFNQRREWNDAVAEAGKAIAVPDQPGALFPAGDAFIRISARIQRSLALYRLGKLDEAHADADAAIAAWEHVRNASIVTMMKRVPKFEDFEPALWIAKGVLLDAESRNEEALAAYTRAARLEKTGNVAAVARGYALASTGAFVEALAAFEEALIPAANLTERASALAGKGRVLVRLNRFEEAIASLQAALDARLIEPDNNPSVFELLGIAYNALQRNGAARHAFRRAWALTDEDKRSANLARGVTAAELRVGDPTAALKFLDEISESLKEDRTLQFNRALALDALGRRREAIGCLVRAKKAGLDRAQEQLDRLDAPAGLARWTSHWFGAQASPGRLTWGIVLMLIAAAALAGPIVQWYLFKKIDGYLLLLPSVIALALLALPNLKSLGFEAGGIKFSAEPLTATGRDVALSAPEGFNVPALTALSIGVTESVSTPSSTLRSAGGERSGSELGKILIR